MKREIVLIVHNVRSCHNVGSLLRTAEGLGIAKVWLTGYTPHPGTPNDPRLLHVITKTQAKIHKTALGAEELIDWEYCDDVAKVITTLQGSGSLVYALEQTPKSVALPSLQPSERVALLVGREVEGIEPEVLAQTDIIVEIPMFGQKESFNVVQAAAMALYELRVR